MITYLIGKPVIFNQKLTLLVNGVGYGLTVTNQLLSNIQDKEVISLHVYTQVTQDKLELFGFQDINDKQLFKLLISVSGVGPATAINILNKGSKQVIKAIQVADVSFFTSVKRVGKKAGQKIIIELKNKLGGIKDLDLTPLNQLENDVLEALTSLGFDENQVNQVIKQLSINNLSLNQAVKLAIKEMGRTKNES